MAERRRRETRLLTYLDMAYFSLAMSFVEESASAFGMDPADTLRLRLAAEEIFTYLAGSDYRGSGVSVTAEDGLYCVETKFLLAAPRADIPIFRVTETGEASEPGTDLAHMGLIIATRFVEHLDLLFTDGLGHGIGLTKEKTYPPSEDHAIIPVPPLPRYRIIRPEGEILKLLVRQVTAYYRASSYPPAMEFPGKVADMIAEGRYCSLAAIDGQADVGGGIFWHNSGSRMIEAAGPYVFGQPMEHGMAEALVARLLTEVAKTDALCLTDAYATPELPDEYFESLGSIDRVTQDGHREPRPLYYRHLKEDPGFSVWANADLAVFLRKEYERLCLARDIRITSNEGETKPPHSLFSLRVDRAQGNATLRPVWDGRDASAVLGEHVRLLRAEGFFNLFFEIDLARPWETELYPILVHRGFAPRLILPHAGKADLVVFQHQDR